MEIINGLTIGLSFIIGALLIYVAQKVNDMNHKIDSWRQTALDTNKICNSLRKLNDDYKRQSNSWKQMYYDLKKVVNE